MKCPNCGTELDQEMYYDHISEDSAYYNYCDKCGWDDYPYDYLNEIKEREENNMITREMIVNKLKNLGYEVQSTDVTKNGVKLQGITIGTETVRPTIYVDDLLDMKLNDAVDDIINTYEKIQNNPPMQIDLKDLMKWDNVKTKLKLCLQRKGDEDIIKRNFLDLEQYVRVMINMNNGTGSFKVTSKHLESFGITEEQLFNAAWDNTKPTLIKKDMVYKIAEMMGITVEELQRDIPNPPKQIFLSNIENVHGAIAMKDTWMLSEIADSYKSDLVILPSSIHEVIIVPLEEDTNFFEIDEMIKEINETQVAPEEQLSDHAYRFDRNTREITF